MEMLHEYLREAAHSTVPMPWLPGDGNYRGPKRAVNLTFFEIELDTPFRTLLKGVGRGTPS